MPLLPMRELLIKAKKERYAVPQFNVWNLEWIKTILQASQKLKTPVILGVSVNGSKYMGGYKVVMSMIKSLMDCLNISIPVAVHLDHATSVKECFNAIDAGFTSVMIDASKFDFETNVKMTKEVVDYAHARNVTVEAELGRIGGKEDYIVAEEAYAIPDECVELVKQTNIDCLAPALGSVHGIYHGEPKLGFVQMEEISNKVSLPLVLHGGSGIPDEQIKRAITCGTAKINVNTDCLIAWKDLMDKYIGDNPNEIDPRKIIGSGLIGIENVVINRCEVFGSIGKAED